MLKLHKIFKLHECPPNPSTQYEGSDNTIMDRSTQGLRGDHRHQHQQFKRRQHNSHEDLTKSVWNPKASNNSNVPKHPSEPSKQHQGHNSSVMTRSLFIFKAPSTLNLRKPSGGGDQAKEALELDINPSFQLAIEGSEMIRSKDVIEPGSLALNHQAALVFTVYSS
ncbi:hypothetical protein V6N12_050138 [Hibiscus sabdariffa]|uniref:Uncharacterized protein n=1 Tax=Hibiscus sabdariffa TaxID=183260 RepID=A0ABR2GBK0_9ROSI